MCLSEAWLGRWGCDILGVWAGRKHGCHVVMSRQRRVMSVRRPIPEKCKCPRVPKAEVTSNPVTCPRRGFPLVHLIVCRARLLMRARTSPPSLPETPCAPECSPWTEPLPEGRWQGATSGRPGRCLPRTHLSPGSQRSTCKWKQEAEKQYQGLNEIQIKS